MLLKDIPISTRHLVDPELLDLVGRSTRLSTNVSNIVEDFCARAFRLK